MIEARRSLWEIAYVAVIALGCLGFYWLSTLEDKPAQVFQLYAVGACALWALLAPWFRRLTLIDVERGEVVRERSLFVTFHRSVHSFHAQALRLEREVWFSEARSDHYYRMLIECAERDIHLGRVKNGMRALGLAQEVATFLDVTLLDESDEVKRVLPIFGATVTHQYDQERTVV